MGLTGLNWIDLVILLIAVFSLVAGYVRGMLRQIIWLAALYIATVLGAQYYSLVGGWIRALTFQDHSSRIVNAIAFLIIVFIVSFLLSWLAADAYPTDKLKLLPWVNQIGGSVLALITMVVMASVVLGVLTFSTGEVWPGNEELRFTLMSGLRSSLLVPFFESLKDPLLKALLPWLPAGLPSIFNL
ncbi:MAG: CvpA family protein [Chloroflexota bacterium]